MAAAKARPRRSRQHKPFLGFGFFRTVWQWSRIAAGDASIPRLVVNKIDPEFAQANISDNKLVINKEFLRYIATVTVGTARGIQYAKTQNTILNGMVLPPIDLMTLNLQDMDLLDPED